MKLLDRMPTKNNIRSILGMELSQTKSPVRAVLERLFEDEGFSFPWLRARFVFWRQKGRLKGADKVLLGARAQMTQAVTELQRDCNEPGGLEGFGTSFARAYRSSEDAAVQKILTALERSGYIR